MISAKRKGKQIQLRILQRKGKDLKGEDLRWIRDSAEGSRQRKWRDKLTQGVI